MMLRLSSRRGPHGAISDGVDVATSWRSARALNAPAASVGMAVGRFTLTGFFVRLGVGPSAVFVAQRAGRHEAIRDARVVTRLGAGFDPGTRLSEADGHFGPTAIEDLVREHGGTLDIDSAPGRGTVLRVALRLT